MPDADESAVAVERSRPTVRSMLIDAADFRRSRIDMQEAERARLVDGLALPVVVLSDRRRAGLGTCDIDVLADELVVARIDQVADPPRRSDASPHRGHGVGPPDDRPTASRRRGRCSTRPR